MSATMTVGKLRELLHDLPDDMAVVVVDGDGSFGEFGVFLESDEDGIRCQIDLTATNVDWPQC